MTSLWRHSRLTYYDLGPNFLTQGVELLAGEVWQVSKELQELFAKNHRVGPFGPPPPAGRGLTDWERNWGFLTEGLSNNVPLINWTPLMVRGPSGSQWHCECRGCSHVLSTRVILTKKALLGFRTLPFAWQCPSDYHVVEITHPNAKLIRYLPTAILLLCD